MIVHLAVVGIECLLTRIFVQGCDEFVDLGFIDERKGHRRDEAIDLGGDELWTRWVRLVQKEGRRGVGKVDGVRMPADWS